MLENLDLSQIMEKEDYKETLKRMEKTLTHLQQQVMQAKIPVVIVFEGWSASGKGTYISRVVNPLDPRYVSVRTTGTITDEKRMRPFMWTYWRYLPQKGNISILDKSWHRLVLPNVRNEWALSATATEGFYDDVNAFERQLIDNGYLVIKFFLHISREEQRRRFRNLEKDPSTSWRNKPHDWKQNENYERNLKLFEKMLKMTTKDQCKWNLIEAEDRRFATCKIMGIIIDSLEKHIEKQTLNKHLAPQITLPDGLEIPKTLSNFPTDGEISDKEYRKWLALYQEKMRTLTNQMYSRRKSCVIVYEGWDAAGKGGNIKRLTSEIDPRMYEVIPVAAPSPGELARHYLWRFMIQMPKDGHLRIFDRSWYGRVLVERVEGFATENEWKRAFNEINEMEQHLISHGVTLLKFWLHIDKDEQLRRFESRQEDPLKQYKITEEDWRNREKWDVYEIAADEMLARTNKPNAPWLVVESNNKKFARIQVLKAVTEALEVALR